MTDKTIAQLDALPDGPTGGDMLPVQRGSVTYRVDASDLGGGGGGLTQVVVNDTYTAAAGETLDIQLAADKVVTLPPTPADFDTVGFTNQDGSLATHTLTINGNGAQIGKLGGSFTDELTVHTAFARFGLMAFDGQWSIT